MEVEHMNTYFKNVQTLEELRKQYRDLLKKYHPDNENGSEEITKAINTEYEKLFKILKNRHDSRQQNTRTGNTTNNNESSYDNKKYDFAEDELLREMLQKVIFFSDITIEIIGNWIWISGNTYQYRKELKELGFKFAGQKKCWYWHSETFRKKSHRKLSMDDIRDYYGSTEIEPGGRKRLHA